MFRPRCAGSLLAALIFIWVLIPLSVRAASLQQGQTPKNIILLIGDGMGFAQVAAAGMYQSGAPGTLSFESLPYRAEVTTYAADNPVTDSAAGATAMATGHKVNYNVLSMAYPGDGSEYQTLLEYYRDQGKMTGLVTTTTITHATPAAFGAHEPIRSNLAQIADDYLVQTRPNVLFGGGTAELPAANAAAAGYTVVTDRATMQALNTDTAARVLGYFGLGHIPYEWDGVGELPHLSEMSITALDILDNDPDGFFLMIEGGRIDHAGHERNLPRNIHETVEFSHTVQAVLNWASGRNDTLIVVTADHETGGLSIQQNNGQGSYPIASFSTGNHTGQHVPIYATGPNAEQVDGGVIDNTDVYRLLLGEPITNKAGVHISPTTLNLTEGGPGAAYQVALNNPPASDVIFIAASDSQLTVNPNLLVFTPENWNIPQPLTATAVDDGVGEGMHFSTIFHATDSTESAYDDIKLLDSVLVTINEPSEETPTDEPTPTDEVTPTDEPSPTDEATPTDDVTPTDAVTPTDSPTDEPTLPPGECTKHELPYVRPVITWTRTDDSADGSYIIVWNATQQLVAFAQGFEVGDICAGTTCTITPDETLLPFGLLNGEHQVYVQGWTNGGELITDWTQVTTFDVSIPAPALPAVTINPNQGRPTITWGYDPNTAWTQVYIGRDDGRLVYLNWHSAAEVCCGDTCTLKPAIDPPAGTYHVYMQAWGPGGTSQGGIQGWSGAAFSLPDTPPAPPTNLQTDGTTFSWQGSAGVTWYEIWIGTIDPVTTAYTGWHLAESLGCENAEVCSLIPDSLPPGAADWFVRGWGPGGFTQGGALGGWAQGNPFSVSP